MTVPAHPDCQQLLTALTAADHDTAELVDTFPTPADPRHLAATLTLWQRLADHAPACSVLADCWITADTGPTGIGIDALAVSVDHPDRTHPVQLVRYIDAHRLANTTAPAGPAGATASVEILADAVSDLDRAVAGLTDPATVLHPDPLQPAPGPLPTPAWSLR